VSPEEYVAVSFSLSATKMCVEIVQERQRARGEDRQRETHTETETETDLGAGRPRIAVGFVSQFRAELAKRKQGFRADLRVGEVGVLGADETQKVVGMRWRERRRGSGSGRMRSARSERENVLA